MVRKNKKIRKEEKKGRVCSIVGSRSSFRAFFITGRDKFTSGEKNRFFSDMFFVNTFYKSVKRGLLPGSLVSESGVKGGSKWSGFTEVVTKESKSEKKYGNLTVQVKAGQFNCLN